MVPSSSAASDVAGAERMLFPIRVDVRDSRRLRVALLFVHGLAAAGLVATDLSFWLVAALAVALAISTGRAVRRESRQGVLILERDGSAAWQAVNHCVEPLESISGVVLLPGLVLLRIRPGSGALWQWLVLTIDSCDAVALRRLRVWLGWIAGVRAGNVASGSSDPGR